MENYSASLYRPTLDLNSGKLVEYGDPWMRRESMSFYLFMMAMTIVFLLPFPFQLANIVLMVRYSRWVKQEEKKDGDFLWLLNGVI